MSSQENKTDAMVNAFKPGENENTDVSYTATRGTVHQHVLITLYQQTSNYLADDTLMFDSNVQLLDDNFDLDVFFNNNDEYSFDQT
jgi:hypothetical protein